jgi:hypothetical protein
VLVQSRGREREVSLLHKSVTVISVSLIAQVLPDLVGESLKSRNQRVVEIDWLSNLRLIKIDLSLVWTGLDDGLVVTSMTEHQQNIAMYKQFELNDKLNDDRIQNRMYAVRGMEGEQFNAQVTE